MSGIQVSSITVSQPQNGMQTIKVPTKDGVIHEVTTSEDNVDAFLKRRKRIGRGAALSTGLLDVGAIALGLTWIGSMKEKWLFRKIGKLGRGITGVTLGLIVSVIGDPIIDKVATMRQAKLADRFVKDCEKIQNISNKAE